MLPFFKSTALIALFATTSVAAGVPERRAPARRSNPTRPAPAPAPAKFDPRSYAASIAGVDCSNVASRTNTIIPIEKPLRGIASRYSSFSPLKGEFESTATFSQRIHDEISSDLGGTDRIVAVIPLRDMIKYDADTSVVTIDPIDSRVKENVVTVKAYSGINETGRYAGSNAYGATAQVTRETFTQFFMLFPARGATTIKDTMAPEAARSLKENGSLILIGSLLSPYIATERAHSKATVSDPTDTTYLKFYLAMVAQCAIVVNERQEIGRLGL